VNIVSLVFADAIIAETNLVLLNSLITRVRFGYVIDRLMGLSSVRSSNGDAFWGSAKLIDGAREYIYPDRIPIQIRHKQIACALLKVNPNEPVIRPQSVEFSENENVFAPALDSITLLCGAETEQLDAVDERLSLAWLIPFRRTI